MVEFCEAYFVNRWGRLNDADRARLNYGAMRARWEAVRDLEERSRKILARLQRALEESEGFLFESLVLPADKLPKVAPMEDAQALAVTVRGGPALERLRVVSPALAQAFRSAED